MIHLILLAALSGGFFVLSIKQYDLSNEKLWVIVSIVCLIFFVTFGTRLVLLIEP